MYSRLLVIPSLFFFISRVVGVPTQDSNNSNGSYSNVVDLGYQLNQSRIVNQTLITFRNVRYAAAPVGDLRFKAPVSPPTNRSGIQDHADVVAPQAYPSWLVTGATNPVNASSLPPPDSNPRASEDCLFLDVLMSQKIWEGRQKSKAPVLVWIHGGGFDTGDKDANGRGGGLVLRSVQEGDNGVILVSINYRLGMFGWMHGDGVQANLGLMDQRFALDWVQKYIHLFGGDERNVTVMGESSGGASIAAHITAYGGQKGPSPFVGAIIQSPMQPPRYPPPHSYTKSVLKYGNVSSLDALRAKSTQELQLLNALICGNAKPYGSFLFGLFVDSDYVPSLPNKLLLNGQFDKSVAVMTGHNGDEGSLFVSDAQVQNEADYVSILKAVFNPIANDTQDLDQVTQKLYPPTFNGSQGYTDQAQRNNLTFADALVVCNARALDAAAFRRPTYAYEFTGPPDQHTDDLPYTFYDSGNVPNVNATVAETMQMYFTNFAKRADPNSRGLPRFMPSEQGKAVQNIGSHGIGPMADEGGIKQLPERCHFWQTAPYLPKYKN